MNPEAHARKWIKKNKKKRMKHPQENKEHRQGKETKILMAPSIGYIYALWNSSELASYAIDQKEQQGTGERV